LVAYFLVSSCPNINHLHIENHLLGHSLSKYHLSDRKNAAVLLNPDHSRSGLTQPCVLISDEQTKPCFVKLAITESHCLEPKECVYCHKQVDQLETHVEKEHALVAIRCSYSACVTFFKSISSRDDHISEIHPAKQNETEECDICKKQINSEYLWKHMKFVHRVLLFRCSRTKCASYFKTSAERDSHEQEKHKERSKICIYCNKPAPHMRQHVRFCHPGRAIKCNFSRCSAYFLTKKERELHVKIDHQARRSQCVYCESWYRGKKQMSTHIYETHADILVRCDFKDCATFFLDDQQKLQHMQQQHKNFGDKFKCIYCGRLVFLYFFVSSLRSILCLELKGNLHKY